MKYWTEQNRTVSVRRQALKYNHFNYKILKAVYCLQCAAVWTRFKPETYLLPSILMATAASCLQSWYTSASSHIWSIFLVASSSPVVRSTQNLIHSDNTFYTMAWTVHRQYILHSDIKNSFSTSTLSLGWWNRQADCMRKALCLRIKEISRPCWKGSLLPLTKFRDESPD